MSEIIITSITDQFLNEVQEIFYESSSKKEFSSLKEREEFEWKYLGYYIATYPDFCWVAVDDKKVLGYLVSSPETATNEFYRLQPHLLTFENEYAKFPAHLHMNMHFLSRGRGVGTMLMKKCLSFLVLQGVKGLHILTGKDSGNRAFYSKSGLIYSVECESMALHGISLV